MGRVLCSLLVLAALATSAARADVTYQYTAVPSSNTVQAGGTVTVALYLTETITPITGSSPASAQNQSIIGLDGGVVSAGVFVNTINGNAATISAAANNVAGSANGTNFDTANRLASNSTQAAILESTTKSTNFAGAGFSTSPVTSGSASNTILLGTLTITGGSTAGQTQYAVESVANTPASLAHVPANGNTITAGANSAWPVSFGIGNDLDSSNDNVNGGPPPAYIGAGTSGSSGAFTFTITTTTATPEPSSLLLCGLAVMSGAYTAYRRRMARPTTLEPTTAV
jgi:hypothetical protein